MFTYFKVFTSNYVFRFTGNRVFPNSLGIFHGSVNQYNRFDSYALPYKTVCPVQTNALH